MYNETNLKEASQKGSSSLNLAGLVKKAAMNINKASASKKTKGKEK